MKMDTEPIMEKAGETYAYARAYLNLRLRYLRLEMAEKTARLMSSLIIMAAVSLMGVFILLLFTIAAGIYLGNYLNSFGLSFLIIAFVYTLLAILIYLKREQLITDPIITKIVNEIAIDTDEEA